MNNRPIFTHKFYTKKGDSGAPLIVQHDVLNGVCFIIAIHYGKNQEEGFYQNRSVKITEDLVNSLSKFHCLMAKK